MLNFHIHNYFRTHCLMSLCLESIGTKQRANISEFLSMIMCVRGYFDASDEDTDTVFLSFVLRLTMLNVIIKINILPSE